MSGAGDHAPFPPPPEPVGPDAKQTGQPLPTEAARLLEPHQPLGKVRRKVKLDLPVGFPLHTQDLALPAIPGRGESCGQWWLALGGGREDFHSQERVDPARDAGSQEEEGVQPVATGPGTPPPTVELARVHAKARGQDFPGEAGVILECVEPFAEVLRQKPVIQYEVWWKETLSHGIDSRMKMSSKRVAPRASMSRLRSGAEGRRVPDISCDR